MTDMDKVRELIDTWDVRHDKMKTTSHVLYVLGYGTGWQGDRFAIVWDPIKVKVRRIDRWELA